MKEKKITYLFLLFWILLFNFNAEAQTRIDSAGKLKGIIQKNNIVSTSGVGFAVMPSKHWHCFVYLLYLSTNEELEQMTFDKSSALRIYSFIGLSHNKSPNLKKIKQRLLSDNETAGSIEGCIVDETTVSNGVSKIKRWYYEKSVSDFIDLLKSNEQYRNQLFDDLMNDRKLSRPPYE